MPDQTFSFITYVNFVPSQAGDGLEGRTTKTYGLSETMKSVLWRCNPVIGSAVPLLL